MLEKDEFWVRRMNTRWWLIDLLLNQGRRNVLSEGRAKFSLNESRSDCMPGQNPYEVCDNGVTVIKSFVQTLNVRGRLKILFCFFGRTIYS